MSEGELKSSTEKEPSIVDIVKPLVQPPETTVNGEEAPVIPVIRYRPPFIGTSKHDTRSDAVQLVVENLLVRDVPNWAAQLIAQAFIDYPQHMDDLQTGYTEFNPDVYESIDASMWCRHVVAAVPPFLERIAKGDVEVKDLPESYHQYPSSFCGQRNRRPKMEDKHICVPTMEMVGGENDGASLFGVFDGHGGVDVASYASSHLPALFARRTGTVEERLRESLKELDGRVALRCEKEHWKSGSTAVCVAIDSKFISFAWIGDSAGYVLRSTEVVKMTKEHSPDDDSEAKRVEAAGGMLIWMQGEYRVNGILNLTRSLGDIAGRPMIIADADMDTRQRDGGEYMCILACDGVADCLSTTQIYDTIRDFVREREVTEYSDIASALCEAAKEEGSTDNLSAVVVFLKPPADLWRLFAEDAESDSSSEE